MGEVARLFLKLGMVSFGGPAAHIALMHNEVVTRRGWMTDQQFLDLVGATNLIPGPNAAEMAMHIGLARARWRGFLVAGICFILPGAIIVLGLAVLYVRYGSTPQGRALLYGIEPVVIAVLLQALIRLGRTAIKDIWLALVGTATIALYLLGINELIVLFGGAAVVMLLRNGQRMASTPHLLVPWALPGVASLAQLEPMRAVDLGRLFLAFLKVGALLFGSGYVLLAFLQSDLVHGLGWLTQSQLVDAVAVGQMTPGPVLTAATFIGYVLHGFTGAAVATVAVFLPAFVFVAALNPLVPRLRRSPWTAAALDGANVAALGLMAGVAYRLGRQAIIDIPTILIALAAAVALLRFKINAAWIILAGGALGLIITAVR